MRVQSPRAVALLLSVFFTLPTFAADPTSESFAATLAKSAGSSVASAGGVAVAKALLQWRPHPQDQSDLSL
jgi:hypothetical protein